MSRIKARFEGQSNSSQMRGKGLLETKTQLSRIKSVSKEYDARFILFIIPSRYETLESTRNRELLQALEEFDPVVPDSLTREDYAVDIHLNNQGHREYADFIVEMITSQAK